MNNEIDAMELDDNSMEGSNMASDDLDLEGAAKLGSGCKVDNVIRRTVFKYSFHIEACGFSRGIWVMWGDDVYIDILEVDFKYIHMSYSNVVDNK
ncbi:hypothetical protein Goshw_019165 [Gossypium schwendimanii]|uniref:Uncharacterized protein n=1 Tax=Gossypium schwendimanii TaxID=34291 RepID=A0A7J9KT57_GOSSC|nr:hypothetical protein [Gossypium schwendimanii]